MNLGIQVIPSSVILPLPKNIKSKTPLKGILCIATLIQCIHSYAAVPADYRGTPFDDAAYREEQKALAEKKRPLPGDFIPAQILWDSKTAVVGSGWVGKKATSSIGLADKDAEGKQVIRYHSNTYQYQYDGWQWAKPGDPAVDLTKCNAVSFAIKVTGLRKPDQVFFTITELNPGPIPLREYDPKFDDGTWHTVTIPLEDFKWALAAKLTDRTEARGFTFMSWNWRGSEYELDPRSLCFMSQRQAEGSRCKTACTAGSDRHTTGDPWPA